VDAYKRALRPLLFRLDAERAHELGKTVLRRERLWSIVARRSAVGDDRLHVELAGVRLRNPVGLAAGFDKNCEMLATMAALGFGYAIPGSIRGGVAHDNPRPRILRYPDRESLINCTGFPSRGAAFAARRLERFRAGPMSDAIAVIPNITGFTVAEYVAVLSAVQPFADAIEISLSCPNERYDEDDFLYPDTFQRLMDALNRHKQRPFQLKIRNYNDERERENRLRLVELAIQHGIDAVMLPGSHIVPEPRLSLGRGNLGGRAVFERTLQNIRDVRSVTGPTTAIKALGGIFSAEDAYRAMAAGASSVELLTGLVYEGVAVARRINAGLLRLMDARGISDVRALIGSETSSSGAAGVARPMVAAAGAHAIPR
jgi:dihydroorotate dehydrogenase (fumarate)/dihydroorotate dehydrogenase